jgi:hypothetical protein
LEEHAQWLPGLIAIVSGQGAVNAVLCIISCSRPLAQAAGACEHLMCQKDFMAFACALGEREDGPMDRYGRVLAILDQAIGGPGRSCPTAS